MTLARGWPSGGQVTVLRRGDVRRLSASLLCLLLVCCGAEEDRGAPERIVLVVADTLRADHVGAYGGAVPTPNLDALAERGEIFE